MDTLILGCTHYPLIKTMIGEFMGRDVVLVDPAKTAAHHLERTLSERGLRANHPAGQAHSTSATRRTVFRRRQTSSSASTREGRWSRSPSTNTKAKDKRT